MEEEKYGYDENETEVAVQPFIDTNDIVPVTPPVALVPEVETEPVTEAPTEVVTEPVTEPVVENNVVTNPVIDNTQVVEQDVVNNDIKLKEVEITNEKVSNVKYVFTILLILILGGTIIFMPEISQFMAEKKMEKESQLQPKIVDGSLKCEIERNSDNFDLKYQYTFSFNENKFKKLYYTSETRGDMNLDEKELEKLNDQCLLLKESTTNISGVEVSCKLVGGVLTKNQTLDYSKINVEEAYSAYSEAGGIYPEYKYLQDMDDIEKNMKAAGYTCVRIK